ncbi:Rieske 2Fe-2S domain-containing protein [Altererythrobacter aerius]|uniref:Rieske 2Fe-2S domain-containing protein n=1 Tax=Tsuneonella aeria TaxID=1837929 RepID=A0A6I4TDU9_9SPHN|nr:Rieske 2Fe-2S domain-containing protein [Tsuneonella aeria]MXO74345.1 Rieske 2Fe-2S domain-containing protein [Tsuneonella aeria]
MGTTAEYGLGEFTFPRGWFMVADATKVQDTPFNARYFGEDMVIYRGKSGKVYAVAAYCPHMGTHLGKNSTSYVVQDREHIDGEGIRCPYHAWRFDGATGQCDDIPYSPAAIPKAACVKTWPVKERAGIIWLWHDAEGGAPDYDVPAFEDWDNPEWVQWEVDDLGTLACHPQEVIDNMTDKAHLTPVHGSIDMERFVNRFDDHVVRQYLVAGHKTLISDGDGMMINDTWYTGPGILQSTMLGEYPSLMLICHTPVDDGVIYVWHALLVKTPDVEMARGYQAASLAAFSQDFEIWGNKRACINPLMVKGDGPFHKVRIWYRQFYNPRARAAEFQARVNGEIETSGTRNSPWPDAA